MAAIVVALFHAMFVYEPRGTWKTIYRAAINIFYGEGAVFTFFILSGFVLGLSLAKHHYYTLADVRLFLIRRFWRLWPAMFILALVYEVYGKLSDAFLYKYVSNYAIHGTSFHGLLSNLLFFDTSLFNHVTASLGVEWLFSIIVPFTFIWTHKRPLGNVVLIAVTLPLYYFLNAGTTHLSATEIPWCYLFMCYAGMALAGVKSSLADFYRRIPSWLMRSLVVLCAAICATTVHFGNHLEIYTLAMTFLIGAIVAGRLSRPAVAVLDFEPLVWLGNVSYSFYLLNSMALAFCGTLFSLVTSRAFVEGHFVIFDGLAGLGSIILTIPLAALSYRFLEHPFLKRSA